MARLYKKLATGMENSAGSTFTLLKTVIIVAGNVILKTILEIASPSLSFKIPVFLDMYPISMIVKDMIKLIFTCDIKPKPPLI